MADEAFISKLGNELNQSPKLRQELLRKLGKAIGRTVVSFFTSFRYPVMIEEGDADMIEDVLNATKLTNGLCLVLNSPGGDALAAERIVHTCRVYSGNIFDVWIPRRAKSAATMIALGADRIFMGETSALGPIDPQIIRKEDDGTERLVQADAIVKSFDELMQNAILTQGHLEPYLQQLSRYDAREIEEFRRAHRLAEDIAIRCLEKGMLAGKSRKDIRQKISIFLRPEVKKAHARDIQFDEVQKAGLNAELTRHNEPLWQTVSELYTRSDYLVNSTHCKLVESPDHHFALPWQAVVEGTS